MILEMQTKERLPFKCSLYLSRVQNSVKCLAVSLCTFMLPDERIIHYWGMKKGQ